MQDYLLLGTNVPNDIHHRSLTIHGIRNYQVIEVIFLFQALKIIHLNKLELILPLCTIYHLLNMYQAIFSFI